MQASARSAGRARLRFLICPLVVAAVMSCGALAGTAQAAPAASVTVTLSPATIIANGSSVTTATATISRGPRGAPLAKETKVAFKSSDPGEKISATTNAGGGKYTATITSSTTVGTATISATDSTSTPAVSGEAVLTQTAGPVASVTVALNPTSIVANGSSTTTATATVKDAQGHLLSSEAVFFSSSDPGELIGQVVNNHNGTYSVVIRASTTAELATITATDISVAPPVSGQATLTQTSGATTTSLVASPSVLVTNQTVTLFAVANSSSGPPSGTITFENGAAPILNCVGEPVTPQSPAVTCQTSFAASSSPVRLAAVFTPSRGSTVPGSTATTTLTVTPDSTSLSLAASPTVVVGHKITYTAGVAPPAIRPGPVQPSGSVEFLDNGIPISSCLTQGLMNGKATCTVTYKTIGSHSITARYGGDSNFNGSTASAQTVKVVPLPVLGIVTSPMQWTFYYTPTYSKVLSLAVNGASTSATVVVTCHGRGCPYGKRTTVVAKYARCSKTSKHKCPATKNVDLAPAFKNRHLRLGAQIAVEITRPQWIAKYYAFTIRARRGPRVQISCLAPGSSRPGVGC
ncbi:MAG: Ig-like domain repeat protein [Solirubrobacterales bacterium]|nr:Ig-like domain repeat protein [Solirubrobacterales bacterium]